ncbi:MAG: exo-alpha-sialidase [Chloroflexi bacterium]|nr:exo-alpha-sialidase [Chloroflexota bacterium]
MTISVPQLKIDVEPEFHLLSGALQPYLYRSARGTLVVQGHMAYPAVYTYPPKNVFPGVPATAISRDGGHTWELWKPAPDQGLGPTIEGAVLQMRNGATRIFAWIADGPSATGDYTGQMWDTTDEWRTVSGPTPCRIPLPQAKDGHDDGGKPYSGVTFHRTVLELPGGDLLATIYCWFKEDNIPSTYEPKMNRFRCILLRSGDQGQNWRYISTIAADAAVGQEGFDEPAMVRLSTGPRAGRLICVIRTGPRSDPLYQCHSDDEGQTWSTPRPLPLRGVDPDLVEMSAAAGEPGILALSFGWRVLTDPPAAEHGNYVAFSTDQGESWGYATHLPIEAHSGATRSTCYTGLREVEPGKLLVTFDIGWWGTPVRYIGRRFVRVSRV